MNMTVTLLADGRVLFAAGTLDHAPFVFAGLSTAQIYDPLTDTWVSTDDMIASRGEGQVAVSLTDGRVLLVGGMASQDGRDSIVLSDPAAEVYDPTGGG
jgi:N-acetylneuraminic acid mutarotase